MAEYEADLNGNGGPQDPITIEDAEPIVQEEAPEYFEPPPAPRILLSPTTLRHIQGSDELNPYA